MKKTLSILLFCLLWTVLLAGCSCQHEWTEVTCETPKICSRKIPRPVTNRPVPAAKRIQSRICIVLLSFHFTFLGFPIDAGVDSGQDHHGQEADHGIDQADIHQITLIL